MTSHDRIVGQARTNALGRLSVSTSNAFGINFEWIQNSNANRTMVALTNAVRASIVPSAGITMSIAVYLRVSSKGQKLASQRRAVQQYLNGHSIEDAQWFEDVATGANTNRPGLTKLRKVIFSGEIDTVILYRLDRLARSIRDGINLLTDWINAGVRIIITTMQIDLSGALGQTVAALLLGLAQMEREAIRERQAAGIAAWREKLEREGKRHPGGRPVGRYKVDPQRVAALRARGLTYGEISAALGISKPTVRKMLSVAGALRTSGRPHKATRIG